MTGERLGTMVANAVVEAVRLQSEPPGVPIADEVSRVLAELPSSQAALAVAKGILDGIAAAAGRVDRVRVAVTGTGWIGGGIGSVEDTMLGAIRQADKEILVTAYSVTAGSTRVIDELERSAATGVNTRVLVDRLSEQDPALRERLRYLAAQLSQTFHLYDFVGPNDHCHLHAKCLVVDRRVAVVGSANLTYHGMMTSHELAAVIEGPTAEAIATRIDILLQSPDVELIQ